MFFIEGARFFPAAPPNADLLAGLSFIPGLEQITGAPYFSSRDLGARETMNRRVNQWISAAASRWATMALILTVEAPVNLTGNGAQ